MIFTNLHADAWKKVGETKEKGLFDFDFITWMAWTWPPATFFIFIALCIITRPTTERETITTTTEGLALDHKTIFTCKNNNFFTCVNY